MTMLIQIQNGVNKFNMLMWSRKLIKYDLAFMGVKHKKRLMVVLLTVTGKLDLKDLWEM